MIDRFELIEIVSSEIYMLTKEIGFLVLTSFAFVFSGFFFFFFPLGIRAKKILQYTINGLVGDNGLFFRREMDGWNGG